MALPCPHCFLWDISGQEGSLARESLMGALSGNVMGSGTCLCGDGPRVAQDSEVLLIGSSVVLAPHTVLSGAHSSIGTFPFSFLSFFHAHRLGFCPVLSPSLTAFQGTLAGMGPVLKPGIVIRDLAVVMVM